MDALTPDRPTTLTRERLRLPVAPIGPDNPLPPLRPPADSHRLDDDGDLPELPADMARQIRYGRLTSLMPCRLKDNYGRERAPGRLDALVLENAHLRATVVPGLGGRLWSLEHRGRELLYRNPVLQPAHLGLTGAWFAGGVEWNLGSTGHTTLTCEPMFAAEVPGPDGTPVLRLWEWERTRDLPYQVDLWLPPDSEFLLVGVRVRNPHDHEVPAYWWSNIAVPEGPGTRVLAPAGSAWNFGYERRLRRVPVPRWDGIDRTYPARATYATDFFYDIDPQRGHWIAAVDEEGHGFAQASTGRLRGRKLFLWGTGPSGQRWQDWLTEPGTGRYIEIQAGLARTQLEHIPLPPGSELSWLEAYGPVSADAAAVHGDDWERAVAAVSEALPRPASPSGLRAAHARWREGIADRGPGAPLAYGSGWGAVEVTRAEYALPGTPFTGDMAGPAQRPWLELSRTGALPETDPADPPAPGPVSAPWRELLEAAPDNWHSAYHRGLARWRGGDRDGAVAAWELSERLNPTPWASRGLAVADAERGRWDAAADRLVAAYGAVTRPNGTGAPAPDGAPADGVPADVALPDVAPAVAALAREAMEALLAAGRAADCAELLARLPAALRTRGRFRLLEARVLLGTGDRAGARAIFENGFDLADLRESDPVHRETWSAITDDPLPERYDFRMHSGG